MAKLLIVDDQATNRELLRAYLEGAGHELYEADSGEAAISAFAEHSPDLVLLDIMMPRMNGFAATERIKALAGERFVPIILVTALNDPTSRLLGLRAGADEFLSKPVEPHELEVRIRNLLELRAKEQALTKKNLEQQELHRFKDDMVATIVHDLKNPLSVVLSNLQYALMDASRLEPETREALREAELGGQRMLRLLANLYDVTRAESARLELRRAPTRLSQLLEPLVAQRAALAQQRRLSLDVSVDPSASVSVDADMMSRVVENLLDNAFRHVSRGGRVRLEAGTRGDRAQICVGNTGEPIPLELRSRLFEKFARASAEAPRLNLGLGLYFCRLAVEAHGGQISVGDTPELSTRFTVDLPAGEGGAASEATHG